MTPYNLPINFFDCLVIAVLVGGIVHGRKNGMSVELARVLKWLTILIACSLLYMPAGAEVAQTGNFTLLSSYIMAYLGCALLIMWAFMLGDRYIFNRIIGTDTFGRAEYYLGMVSGAVRAGCILLAAMALLNAKAFDAKDISDMKKFQNDMYGSNLFPTLASVQEEVFQRSYAGQWVKEKLDFLLIRPTFAENKQFVQREFQFP